MPTRRRVLAAAVGAAGLVALPSRAAGRYDVGASDTEIKLGQTMPYSGPASALATIGKTQQGWFRMINDQGGIGGRSLRLVSLDDGYSPPRTVEQVRRLVESEQVLALFQMLGTAGNMAVHRYVNAKKVPHLFLGSGATLWGEGRTFPWTMGFNLSYQAEARIYAKHLLKVRPGAKVAVLYQNDDFGKDLLRGLTSGLGPHATTMIVATATYETSDPSIDSQLISLQGSGADTFFNFATPKFSAQAIRGAFESGWKPLHFVSNAGSSIAGVLMPAGADRSRDVITVQYTKDPNDPAWKNDPSMLEWRAFMARYHREGDPKDVYNLYACLAAQAMVHVLRQCGNDLRRENVMRQAAAIKDLKLPLLLPGVTIGTSPTDFYPIQSGQLSRFDGAQWQLFGPVIDSRA
jgi:branched-chain amino acid transport system substrate-binding protein